MIKVLVLPLPLLSILFFFAVVQLLLSLFLLWLLLFSKFLSRAHVLANTIRFGVYGTILSQLQRLYYSADGILGDGIGWFNANVTSIYHLCCVGFLCSCVCNFFFLCCSSFYQSGTCVQSIGRYIVQCTCKTYDSIQCCFKVLSDGFFLLLRCVSVYWFLLGFFFVVNLIRSLCGVVLLQSLSLSFKHNDFNGFQLGCSVLKLPANTYTRHTQTHSMYYIKQSQAYSLLTMPLFRFQFIAVVKSQIHLGGGYCLSCCWHS